MPADAMSRNIEEKTINLRKNLVKYVNCMELMASRTEKKKKLGAFQSIQLTVKRQHDGEVKQSK